MHKVGPFLKSQPGTSTVYLSYKQSITTLNDAHDWNTSEVSWMILYSALITIQSQPTPSRIEEFSRGYGDYLQTPLQVRGIRVQVKGRLIRRSVAILFPFHTLDHFPPFSHLWITWTHKLTRYLRKIQLNMSNMKGYLF